MDRIGAREAWELAEPVHAVTYFAPEVTESTKDAGLRGFWMSYFAARVAPLGPVPAEVATALVYNFHPLMVERAIPDAWGFASPRAVLDARDRGVATALLDIVGGSVPIDDLLAVSGALRGATESVDTAGRALFAGHASQEWPDDPLLGVWHGCTCLREHRGDGHVAALVAAGVGPCETHVLLVAQGRSKRDLQQAARGWTDNDWSDAHRNLEGKGWLDHDGALTDSGSSAVAEIERRTDASAQPFVEALAADALDITVRTLGRIRAAVLDVDVIPFPNPIGVGPPT